jgi:NADPH:quinone reductase-like Zn-dependent oxidoreductase
VIGVATMRAVVQTGHGSIDESLRVQDVAVPRPGPREVLLRVRVTTLNRKDLFALANLTGPGIRPRPPLPHVSGGDAAGEIVETGADVTGWKPGDSVVAYGGLYCGECEYCLAGETTACVHYGVLGEQTWGAHAEFVVVRARNLERVPRELAVERLACAGGSWTTAWRALVTVAAIRAGETVLVLGASGGVGTGALRIASRAGCRVIAATSGEEKRARALACGADEAVDHRAMPLREAVRDLTGGLGVDVVLDSVGAATWRDSINVLRPFGRLVVCGATSGDAPDISIRELYQAHRRILGAPLGNRLEFRRLVTALVDGALEPTVHAVLPLARVHDALRLLESRTFFGKIALAP